MSNAHDDELIARLRAGDQAAYAQLVEEHAGKIYRLALRLMGNEADAEDVLQETFLSAFRSIDRFEARSSLSTWLYRIASNLAIDALRARGSRDRTHQTHLRLVGEEEAPKAPELLQEKEVESIFSQLAQILPPAQRQAFVLREVEGLSTSEVAKIMGCTETTVRNHVFSARATLRRELARRYPEYLPRGGEA